MRALHALLACLLLTAGCSALAPTSGDSDATPSPTATAAPVPTEADDELAPGVTRGGIENASALLAAHNEAVDGEFVGLVGGFRFPDGGPTERRFHLTIAPDRERYYGEVYQWREMGLNNTTGPPDTIIRVYGNEEATFRRVEHGNETRFDRNPAMTLPPEQATALDVGDIVRTLAVDRVEETREGVRLVGHPQQRIGFTSDGPESVTITLEVTSEGRIRRLAVEYPWSPGEDPLRAVEYVSYVNVGAGGVVEPNWLPHAREATDNGTVATPRTHTATP